MARARVNGEAGDLQFTAGHLHHQNVVGVYAMGVDNNTPYYSMEYVEGETLAQIVAQIKDVDETVETPFGKRGELAFYSNLATAFADVADGLQHAHSKGVIHRDIKPSNRLVRSEEKLLRLVEPESGRVLPTLEEAAGRVDEAVERAEEAAGRAEEAVERAQEAIRRAEEATRRAEEAETEVTRLEAEVARLRRRSGKE